MTVQPPSTKIFDPVMYEAASEAIKVTTFATSSELPNLLNENNYSLWWLWY